MQVKLDMKINKNRTREGSWSAEKKKLKYSNFVVLKSLLGRLMFIKYMYALRAAFLFDSNLFTNTGARLELISVCLFLCFFFFFFFFFLFFFFFFVCFF